MSKETYEALEEAIKAHIVDEVGEARVVTDWLMIGSHIGKDWTRTGYYYACSKTPYHNLLGLASIIEGFLIESGFQDDSEEDDEDS